MDYNFLSENYYIMQINLEKKGKKLKFPSLEVKDGKFFSESP
jgi:hypothetical protein